MIQVMERSAEFGVRCHRMFHENALVVEGRGLRSWTTATDDVRLDTSL